MVGVPSELTEEEVKAFIVAAPGVEPDFAELHAFAAEPAGRVQGAPVLAAGRRAAPDPDRAGGQAPAAGRPPARRVRRRRARPMPRPCRCWASADPRGDHVTDYPTSIGTSDATSISLLGHDLATEMMGQVSFGELAFWLVALRRPEPGRAAGVRGGAGRAGRPRVHPVRHRRPAHADRRARVDPGRPGRRPARRRLAVPRRDRGLRPVPGRRARHPRRRPAQRRRRLGRAGAPRPSGPSARPAGSCPASAIPSTRPATRAPPSCSASPRRPGSSART